MGDCFQMQASDSVRLEDVGLNSFTNLPTITHQQHHQISQTIFWCVNDHTTCDDYDMNIEIIDISDDEEEEDENASQNGSVVCLDDNEIEVIELSDESEDEVNDESIDENRATFYNQKISELSKIRSLDLAYKSKLQHQQPTDFEPSTPSTSQKEQCQSDEEEDNTNRIVSRGRVLITLGLSCRECSKLFNIQSKLQKHLMRVHGKLPYKCMVQGCNGEFEKRIWLSEHYASHKTNLTKLICSVVNCTFETSIRNNFVKHVYENHEKGLFQCAICLAQYSHRNKLFNHNHILHKQPQNMAYRRFPCPVDSCHFVGRNNFYLKRHQLTHTQLRPFRCTWPDCGFAMNYRSSLIRHIRVKHLHIPRTRKEAAQRNLQCDLDPNQFVSKISFHA